MRLCKGAYDEPASVAFGPSGPSTPTTKRLMERLLRADVHPALATHDAAAHRQRDRDRRERADRAGPVRVPDALRRPARSPANGCSSAATTVRVYVPYGHEWYPYFMRRLAERPANVGFMLRAIVAGKRAGGSSEALTPAQAPVAASGPRARRLDPRLRPSARAYSIGWRSTVFNLARSPLRGSPSRSRGGHPVGGALRLDEGMQPLDRRPLLAVRADMHYLGTATLAPALEAQTG